MSLVLRARNWAAGKAGRRGWMLKLNDGGCMPNRVMIDFIDGIFGHTKEQSCGRNSA